MDPLILNWLYLLLIISIAYWLIVVGIYLFPAISPFIISIISLVIVYIISNQQSFILLI